MYVDNIILSKGRGFLLTAQAESHQKVNKGKQVGKETDLESTNSHRYNHHLRGNNAAKQEKELPGERQNNKLSLSSQNYAVSELRHEGNDCSADCTPPPTTSQTTLGFAAKTGTFSVPMAPKKTPLGRRMDVCGTPETELSFKKDASIRRDVVMDNMNAKKHRPADTSTSQATKRPTEQFTEEQVK